MYENKDPELVITANLVLRSKILWDRWKSFEFKGKKETIENKENGLCF